MKCLYLFSCIALLICGCTQDKNATTKQMQNNTIEDNSILSLQCSPNCSFEEKLNQQYNLSGDNYIDKNKDSQWVIEQKQQFILDSLPKDYNMKTNPAKDRDFSGIGMKNGLGFAWTEYQLANDLYYIKTFTREMYNQHGNLRGWEKTLLLDTKNNKVLGIDDVVKSPQAKAEIINLVAESSVGNIIKSNCYTCKSDEDKAKVANKKIQEVLEQNWSLEINCKTTDIKQLSFRVCIAKGGNSSQTSIVGGCYDLDNQQAKQLLKPEFLKYENLIRGKNYCLPTSRY